MEIANKRVLVTGHTGLVGSAILRRLNTERCIIKVPLQRVDLRSDAATLQMMEDLQPDIVIHAAGKVGGIAANVAQPVQFLSDNARMATAVIDAAAKVGVKRLLFLGSSCIYPREAPQPISEEAFLSGSLEPTNVSYAIAKMAGVTLCNAYASQYGMAFNSLMPANLYGPGDNYRIDESHVPAALIRRFHEAKISGAPSVKIWGSGTPRREFLAAADLADACVFAVQNWAAPGILNVGTGQDMTIADFARTVASVVGYRGAIEFDSTKPDGAPRKLLDVSRLTAMGWTARTPLGAGLQAAYDWFLSSRCAVAA